MRAVGLVLGIVLPLSLALIVWNEAPNVPVELDLVVPAVVSKQLQAVVDGTIKRWTSEAENTGRGIIRYPIVEYPDWKAQFGSTLLTTTVAQTAHGVLQNQLKQRLLLNLSESLGQQAAEQAVERLLSRSERSLTVDARLTLVAHQGARQARRIIPITLLREFVQTFGAVTTFYDAVQLWDWLANREEPAPLLGNNGSRRSGPTGTVFRATGGSAPPD